jgi:hypothetical protein
MDETTNLNEMSHLGVKQLIAMHRNKINKIKKKNKLMR